MKKNEQFATVTSALAGAALVFLWILAPVQSAAYSPTFGAAVTSSTTDFKPTLTALNDGQAWLARWDACTANVYEDDVFYVHFQATSTVSGAKVGAGDIRIAVGLCSGTPTAGLSAGQVVTAGDADFDKILINPDGATATFANFNTYTEYLELDGVQGFTLNDAIYVDTGDLGTVCAGEADGLTTCDLRLTARTISGTALAAGTVVNLGQADVSEAGDTDGTFPELADPLTPAGAETLWNFDANENGLLDRGSPADTAYLRFAAGAPADFTGPAGHEAFVPIALDLRLTAHGGGAFGTLVAAVASDVLPVLVDAPANRLVCVPATCFSSPASTDRLLVTWSGTGSQVRMGDLAVNSVSGQTAGTFVIDTSTGVGNSFVASTAITNHLFFVDLSPPGLSEEDPVYINRPAALGGATDSGNGLRISINDARVYIPSSLSGSGGSGTVVASGNTDLTTYGTTDGTALTALKLFNSDRGQPATALRAVATDSVKISGAGGTWGANEIVYASGTSTALGTTVVAGNYRTNPISYAEDSAVVCTNNENADCGDTLTTVANIRITGGDALFAAGEDAYLSADAEISDGDIRLTPTSGGAVGTTVSCAANPPECPAGTGDLTAASFACLTGGDATYNTGEFAYQDPTSCPATVSGTTLTRISPFSFGASSIVASTDPDVSLPLVVATAGHFKITGSDNIFTPGTEIMYVSTDHTTDATDFRVTEITLNSVTLSSSPTVAITANDADVAGSQSVGPGDTLYVSAVTTANSKIPLYGDVHLSTYGSHAFGSMVVAGSSDFTPRVITIISDATVCSSRSDRGINSAAPTNDDAFYWSRDCTSAPFNPTSGDARMTAAGSLLPGTTVLGGDTDTSFSNTVGSTGAITNVRYVDGPSSKASSVFDSGDFLYMNQHVDVAADTVLSSTDIRIKAATVSGTTYNAGTFVNIGDSDRATYAAASDFRSDPDGGGALVFKLKFIDKDSDGVWDSGEHYVVGVDDADCLTPNCSLLLGMGDVFISGAGGSTTVTTTAAPAAVLPTLASPTVSVTCVAPGGSVSATVMYTDGQNRPPTTSNFVLGSTTYAMTTSATSYSGGALYTVMFNAPTTSGTQSGSFSFANAGGSVALAAPAFVVTSSTATAPTLASGSVLPASGAPGSSFTWKVTYTDLNNDAPTVKQVSVDGTGHDMTSGDITYCDGAEYSYSQTIEVGDHTYSFRFKDGSVEVLLPVSGATSGPTVAAATAEPTATTPTTTTPTTMPTTTAKKEPGFEAVFVAVGLAASLAIAVRRRRGA